MSNPPLRVIQLVSSSLGGAADHVYNLVVHTSNVDNIAYDILMPADGGHVINDYEGQGYTVKIVDIAKGLHWRVFRELVCYFQETKPDIVHCHGYRAGLYGRIAAKLANRQIKTIITVHGFHYIHYKNKLKKLLFLSTERLFSLWTDYIIAVSKTNEQQLITHKNAKTGKCSTILNGIDINNIKEIQAKVPKNKILENLNLPVGTNKIVGVIARLRPEKGVEYFVRAIPGILQEQPHAIVLIVGDGELKQELTELANSLGITDKVIWCGHRSDIPSFIQIFDVLVAPSLWEGLPLVPLEAMISGVPVVATNVDGNRDVIGDNEQFGILVESKNSQQIATAVCRLLGDPNLCSRLSANAKKMVQETYTIEKMVAQTIAVYKELRNNNQLRL